MSSSAMKVSKRKIEFYLQDKGGKWNKIEEIVLKETSRIFNITEKFIKKQIMKQNIKKFEQVNKSEKLQISNSKSYDCDKEIQINKYILFCENITKNLKFLSNQKISDIFPDKSIVINILMFELNKTSEKDYVSRIKTKDKDYNFDLFKQTAIINSKKIINLKLDDFVANINSNEIDLKFIPYLVSFLHNNSKVNLTSISNIADFKKIDTSLLKKRLSPHLKDIKYKLNSVSEFTCIQEFIFNDKKIEIIHLSKFSLEINFINEKNDKKLTKQSFEKFSLIVNEFDLKIFTKESLNIFEENVLDSDFKKFLKCEILNITLNLSYTDSYNDNKNLIDLKKIFKLIQKIKANYINLILIGAEFKKAIQGEELEKKSPNFEKSKILSLHINDIRNEFNELSSISYFYNTLKDNADLTYLKKLNLTNIVLFSPLTLIKIAEIIFNLDLDKISFENISVKFEINDTSYQAIVFFYKSIFKKKLNKLIFRNFKILNLDFLHQFSNDFLSTNQNLRFEFTDSMIYNVILEFKFNKNEKYYEMTINSNFNICLAVEMLNLKILFSYLKAIKIKNFYLFQSFILNENSKFFKKIMNRIDFLGLYKLDFINCDFFRENIFDMINFSDTEDLILKHDKLYDKQIIENVIFHNRLVFNNTASISEAKNFNNEIVKINDEKSKIKILKEKIKEIEEKGEQREELKIKNEELIDLTNKIKEIEDRINIKKNEEKQQELKREKIKNYFLKNNPFSNLKHLNISKINDPEITAALFISNKTKHLNESLPHLESLSLKDIQFNKSIIDTISRTSIKLKILELKFSKPLKYYGLVSNDKLFDNWEVSSLVLSRYAILLFKPTNDNINNINTKFTENVRSLELKYVSDMILEIEKNTNISTDISKMFRNILEFKMVKSDVKLSYFEFQTNLNKCFLNLKMVNFDFDTILYFVNSSKGFDPKKFDNNTITQIILTIIDNFVLYSNIHPSNIFIDNKQIVFENNFELLLNKLRSILNLYDAGKN